VCGIVQYPVPAGLSLNVLQKAFAMALHKETKLSPTEQQRRKARLLEWVASPQIKREQNCVYRLDAALPNSRETLMVKQYTNGTFTLQTQSDMALEQALTALGLNGSCSEGSSPAGGVGTFSGAARYFPYGADESGKGDYFGPLVTACVCVPEEAVPSLKALGVTDSKAMTDASIQRVAPKLVEVLGAENIAFLSLMPDLYNTHYAQLKQKGQHLNHLLAMLHAKTLAGLLKKQGVPADGAIHLMVDQFSQGPHVQQAVQQWAGPVQVFQATKAELAYPSVAAASVIARFKFLQGVRELGERLGRPIPLGAGPNVLSFARTLKQQHGMADMHHFVKLHFKTTDQL
jgi:ribonuclease HIII